MTHPCCVEASTHQLALWDLISSVVGGLHVVGRQLQLLLGSDSSAPASLLCSQAVDMFCEDA